MSKTLLNGVNAVLKRHRLIHGASGELASLTDSALQVAIDLTIDAWNETMIKLYRKAKRSFPSGTSTGTLTLATGDDDYDLTSIASDFVRLRWPLSDATNNQFISQYPGGWEELFHYKQITDSDGLPKLGAIRATDGQLLLDFTPTANENGRQYTFIYDKTLIMSAAADVFPFTDDVWQMLVLPVTEAVRRDLRNAFDKQLYDEHVATAASLLTQEPRDDEYLPQRIHEPVNMTDPLS